MFRELEPAKVFAFFEEICGIPHGSGNTQQIAIIWYPLPENEIWRVIRMCLEM